MSTIDDHSVLGPELAGALMTPEEFDAVTDWDEEYVYELINGVLVVTPPTSEGERAPNELLGDLLRAYQKNHPQGAAMDYTLAEHGLRIGDNRRRPDRVIWARLGRTPNVRKDTPAIVIEFVSQGRRNRDRDYAIKRREYLSIGIAEYWIIDRFRRMLTVVRAAGNGPQEVVVREGAVYTTSILPGFELPLALLLAEADTLDRASDDVDLD
jgi:Uma2 family endonuclease